MRDIKIMNEALANKIAAGEVIERPLSVVKELVENAIDANSTKIDIQLIDSGITNIIVSDNGIGMSLDNLKLSVIRHATSKIYDEKEMLRIASLGFRGEALSSMYAISKFEITSSLGDEKGYRLTKVNDNEFTTVAAACNQGTKVEVTNLFYNTPARYSGLTNPIYELSLITNYINKLCLVNPHLSITLSNNGNEIVKTVINNDMNDLFYKIYNEDIAQNMHYIADETNNFKINMYMSSAFVSKSKRSFITIAINSRIIKQFNIEKVIIDSYKNYLHTNQYPIMVLNIDADFSLLDVNIHPNKQEVKIGLIEELLDMISHNITKKLGEITYINNMNSKKIDLDATINLDELDLQLDLEKEIVQEEFDLSNSLKQDNNIKVDVNNYIKTPVQKAGLPFFTYIGTLHQTFLMFENEDGLFLVDQHAAQERINYELILDKFRSRQYNFQQLLVPVLIELTTDEYTQIEEKMSDFKDLGIIVDPFGNNTLRITEIDTFYMKMKHLETDILNIIDLVAKNKKVKFEEIFDDIAIMMACKSSIKAHQFLDSEQANLLIEQLRQCDVVFTCPHGRPVVVNVSSYEIDKLFKRVF